MDLIELVIGILSLGGAGLVLLAGVGVLRFDDLYARMHAATKAPTLGALMIGIAGVVALDDSRPKLALAVVIIFVTAPVSSHMIGRSAYRSEGVELHLEAGDAFAAVADDEDDEGEEDDEPDGDVAGGPPSS